MKNIFKGFSEVFRKSGHRLAYLYCDLSIEMTITTIGCLEKGNSIIWESLAEPGMGLLGTCLTNLLVCLTISHSLLLSWCLEGA